MINFNYETEFNLDIESELSYWIALVINLEGFKQGYINYVFCDDRYLFELNKKFLNHDTLTDIISFDYGSGEEISGDIYISIDRVLENAREFNVEFLDELKRVMVHGVLHFCGYNDKSEIESQVMIQKENHYLDKL